MHPEVTPSLHLTISYFELMPQGLAQKLMPCAGLVPPTQKESRALLDLHSLLLQASPSALAMTRASDAHAFSPPGDSRLRGGDTPVPASTCHLFLLPALSPCTTLSYQPAPSTASHERMPGDYYCTGLSLCTSM